MRAVAGRCGNLGVGGRLAALLTGALVLLALAPVAASAQDDALRPYLVMLKPGAGKPSVVAKRQTDARGADLGHVYSQVVNGYSAEMTDADAKALRSHPDVLVVERDAQGQLTAQTTPRGISRIAGTSNPTLDIDGQDDVRVNVDVAVIDSGVDFDHPDLRVVDRVDCTQKGSSGQDICVPGGDDTVGHGTHVAGTIAALDNSIGVVGVAPGARIWSAKVRGSDTYLSDAIAAMEWIYANRAKIEVVNMSISWSFESSMMGQAISNLVDVGIVFVTSAGNKVLNIDGPPHPTFPARHPDVIAVSALADFDGQPGALTSQSPCAYEHPTLTTGRDDSLAAFSNWGPKVDMAAPGTCILSTDINGTYSIKSGTSMASPHVAGAAAILASTSHPSNRTHVNTIRSTLASQGNYNWVDAHPVPNAAGTGFDWVGDGSHEPLLNIDNESVFRVASPGLIGGLGASSHASGTVDIYARGLDFNLWSITYNGHQPNEWGTWTWHARPNNNAVQVTGQPSVISREPLSRDIFVRGTDDQIYFRNYYAGTWSSWFWIQGPHSTITSSPTATVRPDNGFDIVVRGQDNNIWQKTYSDTSGWSVWKNLGAPPGGATSRPTTTTRLNQQFVDVFVKGGDNAIWHRAYTASSGWTAWVSLGGVSVSGPTAVTTDSSSKIFLFTRGGGDAIYYRTLPLFSAWTGWQSLGGVTKGDPAAAAIKGGDTVDVYAVGTDDRIFQRRFVSGAWTSWSRIEDNCPPGQCVWPSP